MNGPNKTPGKPAKIPTNAPISAPTTAPEFLRAKHRGPEVHGVSEQRQYGEKRDRPDAHVREFLSPGGEQKPGQYQRSSG